MEVTNPSVDQIVAADLAASTAQIANLSIASNASNLSISLNAKSDLAQTNDNVISKPQIFQAAGEHRGIIEYVTVVGDTVPSVASKFGISPQTVRWANGLTSDALTLGSKLSITGTDGVVYTVSSSDTIDSIASRYGVDKQRIVTYNDLEASGVVAGQRLVLPGGTLPQNERPGYAVASVAPVLRFSANAASVGNRYDYGYCTWYVYNKRAEVGRSVGSFWGNAVSWAGYAASSGYLVNNTPAVGAVLQQGGSVAGGYGHVAFVEQVNADGSIRVSEMNYAGWNVVSSRTIDAGQASAYKYLH
ncbi:LysM peptidoglycan-binding domain-containing protein [Pedobacter sp.]|nr:LysM peptidoglycan-binding domain-containing protein [Candidatus Saccharibacteria bacterium]